MSDRRLSAGEENGRWELDCAGGEKGRWKWEQQFAADSEEEEMAGGCDGRWS